MAFFLKNGAPGRIRTSDLLVRSQTLYPTELRAHFEAAHYPFPRGGMSTCRSPLAGDFYSNLMRIKKYGSNTIF